MLDNPQSKLNQQAQQDTTKLNTQTSKQAPMPKKDTSQSKVNTNPQFQQVEQTTLQGTKEQPSSTVPEQNDGFWAKLKQKAYDKGGKLLEDKQSKSSPTPPSVKQQAKTQDSPSSPTPTTPDAKRPSAKRPNPGFKAPSLPKTHIPKIPKLR